MERREQKGEEGEIRREVGKQAKTNEDSVGKEVRVNRGDATDDVISNNPNCKMISTFLQCRVFFTHYSFICMHVHSHNFS